MSFLWHGLTDAGAQVPIQVDAQGRVIAVDGSPGVSNWERTGTTLSPAVPGDDVFTSGDVKVGGTTGSPNISLNADGSAMFAGNVGIGASPSAPITLKADSGGWGVKILGRSSGNYGELAFFKNDGTTFRSGIHSDDNSGLRFRALDQIVFACGTTAANANAERARIDSSGNFLLGGTTGSPNISLNADGSATFAGNVTAANITFRSTDPSYYTRKTTKDASVVDAYSGPEVSLIDELLRLEALVNHLYEEMGVPVPAQKTKATNLMKLRTSSTQGKKRQ